MVIREYSDVMDYTVKECKKYLFGDLHPGELIYTKNGRLPRYHTKRHTDCVIAMVTRIHRMIVDKDVYPLFIIHTAAKYRDTKHLGAVNDFYNVENSVKCFIMENKKYSDDSVKKIIECIRGTMWPYTNDTSNLNVSIHRDAIELASMLDPSIDEYIGIYNEFILTNNPIGTTMTFTEFLVDCINCKLNNNLVYLAPSRLIQNELISNYRATVALWIRCINFKLTIENLTK